VRSQLRDARGFTLVEVAVASLVLLIGTLSVVALVDFSNKATVRSKTRQAATSLTRQIVEDVRAIPFEKLDPNSLADELKSQPGLEPLPGGGYTLRRGNVTFTVDATVCSLDDPRDGIGSHTGGTFCSTGVNWKGCQLLGTVSGTGAAAILGSQYTSAQAAAAGTSCGSGTATAADLDPQDYKRVNITLRWGTNRSTRQTTMIANPGTASGPSITNLVVSTGGGSTTITDPSPSAATIGFTATTSRPPAAVSWTLDGDNQGSISGSGTTWPFNWALGPVDTPTFVDGTYIVGARAVDVNGVAGATRTLTITVNRRRPFAPTGLAAGRNDQVVDLEWRANRERDIVGYYVYRETGTTPVRVCPASGTTPLTATNCQDTAPPAGTLQYHLVAVDRDKDGNLREGDSSTTVTVNTGNNPPNPPTNLQSSSNAGTTILRWDAPNPADPDAGDSIHFYRIYRDGTSYGDRYDRTGDGATLSYTDTSTGGVPHTYWITAVDSQLAESTLAGPKTQ
jgi:hypothetical protein